MSILPSTVFHITQYRWKSNFYPGKQWYVLNYLVFQTLNERKDLFTGLKQKYSLVSFSARDHRKNKKKFKKFCQPLSQTKVVHLSLVCPSLCPQSQSNIQDKVFEFQRFLFFILVPLTINIDMKGILHEGKNILFLKYFRIQKWEACCLELGSYSLTHCSF